MVVIPLLNICPFAFPVPERTVTPLVDHVFITPVQLSAAVAFTAPPAVQVQMPGSVERVRLFGQVIVGTSLSFTVRVKEQVAVLLDASVAR